MRAFWVFRFTNFFGFTKVLGEYAQSQKEALEKLLSKEGEEYPAKVEFLRCEMDGFSIR